MCASRWEFRGRNYVKGGEECKTWEKFNFSEKGIMVISIGNWKFYRSRMTKHTSPMNSSRKI